MPNGCGASTRATSTPQEIFDLTYAAIPADDPFWQLPIGDPGPDAMFDGPVYTRGAMTLQQLRVAVGDDAFFRILRKWASIKRGGNGSTAEFIKLAERVSGQDLDALFTTWLFTPGKPDLPPAEAALTSPAMSTFALQTTVQGTLRHHAALRR